MSARKVKSRRLVNTVHSELIDHTSIGRWRRQLFVVSTFVVLAHGEETVDIIIQVSQMHIIVASMGALCTLYIYIYTHLDNGTTLCKVLQYLQHESVQLHHWQTIDISLFLCSIILLCWMIPPVLYVILCLWVVWFLIYMDSRWDTWTSEQVTCMKLAE